MNILQECMNAKKIGISGHIRPDGDCVGSCLALWQYLKKALPDVEGNRVFGKARRYFFRAYGI